MNNGDIAPVFVCIWLAGVVRIVLALVQGEAFGPELTLVFATVALIPVLLFGPYLARRG